MTDKGTRDIRESPLQSRLGINESVKKYVEACLDCLQKKGATATRHFPLLSIESGIPNELLQVDHLKLSKTECGHV